MNNGITEEDYIKIANDNARLRSEKNKLQKSVHDKIQEVFDCEEKIDKMNNMCWIATSLSFLLSFVFGICIFHSLSPSSGWDAIISINLGVWWFSVVIYYSVWRWKFK